MSFDQLLWQILHPPGVVQKLAYLLAGIMLGMIVGNKMRRR